MDTPLNLPLPLPEVMTPEQRKVAFARAIERLKFHEKQVKGQKSHIKLLSTLAKGTMKERMLVALQYAGPLYQSLCPRKYRDIPTHASPKNLLILGTLAALVFRDYANDHGFDLKGMPVDRYTELMRRSDKVEHGHARDNSLRLWRIIGDMIDYGSPTYFLDQESCEEMLATDCCDLKVAWNDFDWPHPVFMLIPPKGLYENSPVLILVHHDDQFVTFTGMTEGMVDYNQKLFATEFPVKSLIGESITSLLGMKLGPSISEGKTHTVFQQGGLKGFIARTMKLCVNALLAMAAEPNFEELEKPGATSRSASQERRTRDPSALWNPTFFRMSKSQSTRSEGGTGTSPRPHPRRAHWRSVWLEGDPDAVIEVGKRVRHVQDQRVALWVVSIDGDAMTLKDMAGRERVAHRSEVKPARVELKRIKRKIVGLGNAGIDKQENT